MTNAEGLKCLTISDRSDTEPFSKLLRAGAATGGARGRRFKV